MPRTSVLVAVSVALIAAGPPADDPLASGDGWWSRRAEGFDGGAVPTAPIESAVEAYAAAAEAGPDRLEAHWKLLRALWFQGEYAAVGRDAKREVFDRGRRVCGAAKAALARRAGGAPEREDPESVAERYRSIGEAVPIHFWCGVDWGLWGDAFGAFAAARQGVADRVRDDALVVIELDPLFDHGGGYRLLGRLHSEAPKVPFFTGWVDRDEAVSLLERAVRTAPDYLFNRWYLAEALADHRPAARSRAVDLLTELAGHRPDPEMLVEESRIVRAARERLAELQERR